MTPGAVVALAALVGLVATGAYLKVARVQGWGKAIRAEGPSGHRTKVGTPTMGGAAFIAVTVALALLFGERTADLLALAGLVAASALIGLADDVVALRRARAALLPFSGEDGERVEADTGLFARYRLFAQALVGLLFAGYALYAGVAVTGVQFLDLLFLAFVVVGSVNAFNFTDGIDGLAAGVTAIILLLFLGSPLAAALLGALIGFLWYNAHPARLFMGGVGAEALGAAVAGLAILGGAVWWLPVIALLPMLEVVSVVAQVLYFRATGGRRLLRMAPFHHHLELSGWTETRITIRFWLVTAVLVAVAWSGIGRPP